MMAHNKILQIICFAVMQTFFVGAAIPSENFNIQDYININRAHDVLTANNFTFKDYLPIQRGRNLAYEFMDFLKHAKESDLSESRVGLQDLKCLAEFRALTTGISEGKLWAFRVFDAWGSIPAGFLIGRTIDYGNYDECIRIDVQVSDTEQMQGKYCLANIPLFQMLGIEALSSVNVLQMGTCVPASCQAAQLNVIFKSFLKKVLNIQLDASVNIINDKNCKVKPNKPLSGSAITLIVLLSVLGALVVLCTVFDYFTTKAPLHPFVKAFSARVNARQLFRVVDTSKNPNVISCLNGIRCMSLIWVIFAHCFMASINKTNMNAFDLLPWSETAFSMLILEGWFSVDSFFFLSGLLLVMVVLREMDKTSGKLNVPLMYLHRYLRLTPILIFGILFTLSLKYMTDGPLWDLQNFGGQGVCEKNWWSTLLYVQNYVNVDGMCLGQSWYLAVDMQLYVLSPLILIPLWKWGKKAIPGIIVLILLMWACLFSMMMIKEYTMYYRNGARMGEGMYHIYFKTHVRTSPWLVGVIFGYYLHITKGRKIKMSKFVVIAGWIASLSLIFASIFSLLPKGQLDGTPLTTLEEALFVSLTRIAWPVALSWLVFACIHGYGGPIDGFLSAPLWQPLARLSYCIYIFHMAIIGIDFGRMRVNTYFSSFEFMVRFWPNFGFSVLLSVFMYLLVEAPFAGLEQMCFTKKKKPETKPEAVTEAIETKAPVEDNQTTSAPSEVVDKQNN